MNMSNKYAYILSFDRNDSIDYKALHDKITKMPHIYSWSHYIRSSYILITDEESTYKMNEQVRGIMNGKQFLLMKVSLESNDYNGWLPKNAWEWMKEQNENMNK